MFPACSLKHQQIHACWLARMLATFLILWIELVCRIARNHTSKTKILVNVCSSAASIQKPSPMKYYANASHNAIIILLMAVRWSSMLTPLRVCAWICVQSTLRNYMGLIRRISAWKLALRELLEIMIPASALMSASLKTRSIPGQTLKITSVLSYVLLASLLIIGQFHVLITVQKVSMLITQLEDVW